MRYYQSGVHIFFEKLWDVDRPGFDYFRETLHVFALKLQNNDLIWQYLEYILRPSEIPSDNQEPISKHELVRAASKIPFSNVPVETSNLFILEQLIQKLIHNRCVPLPLLYVSNWQWEQTNRHKTWIQYSDAQSEHIELNFQRGVNQCHIDGLSPFLAPEGHIIHFNRLHSTTFQINQSTKHTRNVRRTMIINNLNYLYWLVALQKTLTFLKEEPPILSQTEHYILQITNLLRLHSCI